MATIAEAVTTLERDLTAERLAARSSARFDVEREIAGLLAQLEAAKCCLQKIEEGSYLTPAETAQGAALARTLLLRRGEPETELYWGAIDTLLTHSRRII